MIYFLILGKEFRKKSSVTFKISTLKSCPIEKFCEKIEMREFGTKNILFAYF